jgi:glyoxylase-like metal-dependent hydrolase (beta-lactamase superfamily II)
MPANAPLIRVGAAEIRRVEEMTHRSRLATVAPDDAFVAAHKHWLAPAFLNPDGTWNFTFQSWIMTLAGKVFVIDPCNGNGRPHMYPLFENLNTPYIERFTATGVRLEDVDYVFCTHLHHDHCGWSTQLRDGRYVPTFPNATYLYARPEFERWDTLRAGHQPVDYNVGVFERSVLPILEAGRAQIVEARHGVMDGVTIEPAHGHTLGHAILHVASQAQQAYFTGDCFHHPLQVVDPRLHYPGCDDLEMAIATRRELIARCATTGAMIIPAHFPPPHAGWIRETPEGFRFAPLNV